MKFGIKYDITYNVNQNGVVAICKANLSRRTFRYLYNSFNNDSLFNIHVETKGIARLNPNDESDIELAKKIAKKKAVRTAYLEIKNQLIAHIADVQEYYTLILDSIVKATQKAYQIDEEIMDLVSENE